MKKTNKRLRVRAETVRALGTKQLSSAAGAGTHCSMCLQPDTDRDCQQQ